VLIQCFVKPPLTCPDEIALYLIICTLSVQHAPCHILRGEGLQNVPGSVRIKLSFLVSVSVLEGMQGVNEIMEN
jgi:hypothetical protein